MMFWLRWKLIVWLWPTPNAVGACANRFWRRLVHDDTEITLTFRRLYQPDGYSREELLEMLRTVREHEAIQGWKVPEPTSVSPRLVR
jgi:hypothetical protein